MERRPVILCVSTPHEAELSRAEARRIWTAFLEHGSTHSARAATLPFIIRRCESAGIPYVLTARPGMGYFIKTGDGREETQD